MSSDWCPRQDSNLSGYCRAPCKQLMRQTPRGAGLVRPWRPTAPADIAESCCDASTFTELNESSTSTHRFRFRLPCGYIPMDDSRSTNDDGSTALAVPVTDPAKFKNSLTKLVTFSGPNGVVRKSPTTGEVPVMLASSSSKP